MPSGDKWLRLLLQCASRLTKHILLGPGAATTGCKNCSDRVRPPAWPWSPMLFGQRIVRRTALFGQPIDVVFLRCRILRGRGFKASEQLVSQPKDRSNQHFYLQWRKSGSCFAYLVVKCLIKFVIIASLPSVLGVRQINLLLQPFPAVDSQTLAHYSSTAIRSSGAVRGQLCGICQKSNGFTKISPR